VYFSQINQFHCSTLITSFVGVKIKCYLTFHFVRNNSISFLELISFQRLRITIFTVINIRKLHEQISLFRLKNTPSNWISRMDVKYIQFVVSKFLAIHINGVSYIRLEHVTGNRFSQIFGACLRFRFLIYEFYSYLKVSSINSTLNIHFSSERSHKLNGKYIYHPIKPLWHEFLRWRKKA
jgi:hypothetical protein